MTNVAAAGETVRDFPLPREQGRPFDLAWKYLRDWKAGLRLGRALLRGAWYALYFRLFRRDVVVQLPFLAYHRVSISGPGRVRIGRHCAVYGNVFHGLCITTHSASASVEIGPRCSLGGLTVRCRHRVVLGAHVMTAYSLVQDSLVVHAAPRGIACDAASSSRGIEIGDNAWVGGLCCVLPGSRLAADAVLSWGTTCIDTVVPPRSLVSGNPAGRPISIEHILQLKGDGGGGSTPLDPRPVL